MASLIDPTKPVFGTPTTQSVRDNFAAAKSEIEALQGDVATAEGDLVAQQGEIAALQGGKADSTHGHSLFDITQSAATAGQVPTWSGTSWIPQTPAAPGATGTPGALRQDRFIVGGAVAGNNFPLIASPLNGVALISLCGLTQHEYSVTGKVLTLTEDALPGDDVLVTYWDTGAVVVVPPPPVPILGARHFRINISNANKGIPGSSAIVGTLEVKSVSQTYYPVRINSLTTPGCTASSFLADVLDRYIPEFYAYELPNGVRIWQSEISNNDEWLQIDIGEVIDFDGMRMSSAYPGFQTYMPSGFTLYGSLTGAFAGEEVLLCSASGMAAWVNGETRSFNSGQIAPQPIVYSANLIPIMTGPTTPSGEVTSSPNVDTMGGANWQPYLAFNGFVNGQQECWATTDLPAWVAYDFGAGNGVAVEKYTLQEGVISGLGAYGNQPSAWTFDGWDAASGTWVTLDSHTQEPLWDETYVTPLLVHAFTFTNSVPYEKYRVHVTAAYAPVGSDPTRLGLPWPAIYIGAIEMMSRV